MGVGLLAALSPVLGMVAVLALIIAALILKLDIRSILYLTILLVPFRFEWEITSYSIRLTPFDLLIAYLAFVTLPWSLVRRRIFEHLWVPHLGAFLAYLIVGLVARTLGPDFKDPVQGTWYLYKTVVEFPLLFVLAFAHLRTKEHVEKAVLILLVAMTTSAAMGMVQTATSGRLLSGHSVHGNLRYLGLFPPYSSERKAAFAPYMGIFPNPAYLPGTTVFRAHGGADNHINFGAALSATAPLTLALLLRSRPRRRQRWLAVSFALQSLALYLTFSRAAWMAYLAAVLLVAFLPYLKRWIRVSTFVRRLVLVIIIIGASGLAYLLLPKGLQDRMATLLNPLDTPEMQSRMWVWKASIKQIASHPFLGVGTYRVVGVEFWGLAASSHHIFLSVAHTLGLPALFLFLYILIGLTVDAWCVYRQGKALEWSGIGLGLLAGLFGFVVAGMFSSVLIYEDTAILFWTMAGLAAAARQVVRRSAAQRTKRALAGIEVR